MNHKRIKERASSMQFYFRQFSADEAVRAMDIDAVGAHILLMCAAGTSKQGYKIPANNRWIRAQIRNVSVADFRRIRNQLLSGPWKMSRDHKWWVQDGMRRSLKKLNHFISEQKRKGCISARKRWGNHGYNPVITERVTESNLPSSSSSSTSSTNLKKENPGAKTARRSHTPSEAVRNRKAKESRVAKEEAVRLEAHVGTGPVVPPEVAAAARAKAIPRTGMSEAQIEARRQELHRQAEKLKNQPAQPAAQEA